MSTEPQVPLTRDGFINPSLSSDSVMETAWLPDEMAGIDWVSRDHLLPLV